MAERFSWYIKTIIWSNASIFKYWDCSARCKIGITILMSAAVITHIRLKSRFREYIASVAMLAISLIILANNG